MNVARIVAPLTLTLFASLGASPEAEGSATSEPSMSYDPTNVCVTPVGACVLPVAVPAGTLCTCISPNGQAWTGTAQ